MKKIKWIALGVAVLLALAICSGCFFTVAENEYACTVRFSKIISTTSEAGLHFKLPFVDSVKYFTKATQLYDIPPSEVLTSDKQNMTVDCYILHLRPQAVLSDSGLHQHRRAAAGRPDLQRAENRHGHPGPGGHHQHGGRCPAE